MKDYRRRVRGGNYELRRDLTKNKKATKKTKNKEEIFGRTTTLIFGVISLVTLTSIAVNPNTLKSSISYLTDLARQVQTVQNVSAQEYAELKNPVVEPESNMHPKVIPVVLRDVPQAEYTGTDPQSILYMTMMKAGFSEQKTDFMIRIIGECENRSWNPNAVNVNKDGSKDRGIMQINDKWHKARFESLYGDWDTNITDPIKNIEYGVYQIAAKQADFSAWSCAKKI